ncbi:MAG: tRNA (adenosine(37)-N6)-threonylcarbamoyltransferase complex transferase subunit TsaD [Bacteroidetes bacterium]|nr:MAG: tRNA (adenosine(37)-N6)-threonylcarbamoyltransferase complex transferase subunit TsaD [Bacteroidota bacterium]
MEKAPVILAIESSCDDTSVAVLEGNKVLSNIIANQKVHEEYGGVVPELASRSHQQNILPVFTKALKTANKTLQDIGAIAYTQGPGLLGSLLVGTSFAKGLAIGLHKPLIAVNHMEAHILAHFIADANPAPPAFPFLCLTVSGGHTQIVRVNSPLNFELLGNTLDDAAGEAFDKTAKLLGLGYPGGPLIDKHAKQGNPEAFHFPHPDIKGLDFSFSGLKTSILYMLQREMQKNPKFIKENLNDICASVQKTIIDILLNTLIKAARETGISQVAIAGGVSANSELRTRLQETGEKHRWKVFIPKFEYCTDNAAMIGIAAYYKYLNNMFSDLKTKPFARMSFSK